jgi:hypothetical protein
MSKVETLRQAHRDLLAQHQDDRMLSTSVRSLFYDLVAAEIIAKHAPGPPPRSELSASAVYNCNRNGSTTGPRSAARSDVLCAIFATIFGP